jgi:hypothetical protein
MASAAVPGPLDLKPVSANGRVLQLDFLIVIPSETVGGGNLALLIPSLDGVKFSHLVPCISAA